MVAAPVTAVGRSSSGPRPINLSRDTRQVLELLDLSFGRMYGSQGRRVIYDRLSLSQVNPLTLRLSMMTSGFIPGFVWEENGRIVGNLTLLGSEVFGRYLIANVAVHPDLNWPTPPSPDYYKTGLWHSMVDFLNGRKSAAWVLEMRSSANGERNLIGLVSINSEWGRPIWLRMRVDPAWQEEVEPPLLNSAIKHLKRNRSGTIRMNHPANDQLSNQLLSSANFRIQRSLTIMTLDLVKKG